MARSTIPVLIVGAGPVGLTAALALASYGVPATVVEAEPSHTCEGSRSICVQKHTLELAERIGAGRTLADEGVSWGVGRTYFRTTELFHVRLGEVAPDRFPPFVNIPQWRVEEVLLEAAGRTPLVTLLWAHRVTGLTQDAGGVTVTVQGGDGERELRAAYLIGCDGGRSMVREAVGVGFPGYTHRERFLIADIRADLPFPNERRFFFDPPFNPGRQVLVHPQPDKVWRIDWQVPPGVDLAEERRTGRLDERIRAVVGDVPYEVVWLSQYTFAQRLAERFRVGRVFLAGDAAHLMSVFGARGMNSGMQDAYNLAWKLWLVLDGHAPDALLDSYEAERRAAAQENLRVTEATMRFMGPPNRLGWMLRNLILRLSLPLPWMRRYVDSGKLSQPYVYRDSPIVVAPSGPDGAGARVGAVAPDASGRGAGAARVRALDLVGPHFTALYLARDASDADAFVKAVADETGGGKGSTDTEDGDEEGAGEAGAGTADTGGTGADAPAGAPPVRVVTVVPSGEPGPDRLLDDRGEFADAYGPPGRLYLIRPDTHIAARLDRADHADARALAGALAEALVRATGKRLRAPSPAQAA